MQVTFSAENFRGIDTAAIKLDDESRVALVLGDNGAGKSSIAAAVEYALTGACEWTDAGGGKAHTLIRYGSSQADVQLSMDGLDVTRTINPKGASNAVSANGYSGTKAEAEIAHRLKSADLVRCMVRSDALISLKANQQADILSQLAGEPVDADWVRTHLTDREQAILEQELAVRLIGNELLGHLFKAAEGKRRDCGRMRDDLQAQVQAPADWAPPLSQEEHALLQAEHDTLATQITAKERAVGEASANAQSRERAQARHSEMNAKLDRLRQQRKALGDRPQAAGVDIDSLREQLTNTQDELKATGENEAATRGLMDGLQRGVNAFKGLGGKCVLGNVECPLTAEQRQTALDAAETELEGLRADFDAYVARELELVTMETDLQEQITRAESANTAANDHIRRAEALDDQIAEAETAAHQAWEELTGISTADTAQIETDLAGLRESRDAIAEALQADVDSRKATAARQDLALRARNAHEEYEMLDALVLKLKPQGLPAQAMRETVGLVLDAINRCLEAFAPFSVSLDDAEGLCVTYLSGDAARQSSTVPVRYLSESEQLRVGTAIQVAFAELTEFGLVVVDAADRLDKRSRGPHLRMLLASGVKAVVLAVPLNGTRPVLPGLAVYDLVDGTLVEVQAAQEVPA